MDLMGMMGKLRETQQKIEDTKSIVYFLRNKSIDIMTENSLGSCLINFKSLSFHMNNI